jgi:catechol 2,3-dioxygenase-like lactoylglutathione lyase family enzyme
MQIKISSIFVNNQAKALAFYTEMLGFVKVADIDLGQFRWLTVADSGESGIELVLEPDAHPAAKTYQQTIYEEGIPAMVFHSEDIHGEYEALLAKGVNFETSPNKNGEYWTVVFDDTCGNWIQLMQSS